MPRRRDPLTPGLIVLIVAVTAAQVGLIVWGWVR